MSETSVKDEPSQNPDQLFFKHLARAFGGAIVFSFPLLMTMEMWFLGGSMKGFRLALYTLLIIPLLIGLSYYDGFEATSSILDDTVDTFVAYAVGFTTSIALLFLFSVIKFEMSADELIGKISIQAIVGSFGAMFAQSLLLGNDQGSEEKANRRREASYFGELFLMAIGAIYLSMSVAPTEEVVLISYQMSDWHTLALIIVTLLLMHAFVYFAEFRGQEKAHLHGKSFMKGFLRFTVVGYALALIISAYILWTFGSIDETNSAEMLKTVVVLGFPAAVGASASRFIL